MATPTEAAIRDILREAGRPMTADEIGAQLATRVKLRNAKPANTVRNVLSSYNRDCVSAGRGVFAYLPIAVNGASVRTSLRLAAPGQGLCAIGAELGILLWPGSASEVARAPHLALADGPTVQVGWPPENQRAVGSTFGPRAVVGLPAPFWGWWDERRRDGADQLVVHCEDGVAGRYAATAVRSGELDEAAVEASNAAAREVAAGAMRGHERGSPTWQFLPRLLARRAYHRDVAPDPLAGVLLRPAPSFVLDGIDRVFFRPDLTLGLARIFRERVLLVWVEAEARVRELLGLPAGDGGGAASFDPLVDLGERAPGGDPFARPAPEETEAVRAVRFKVSLQWQPAVWRSIEVRGDQTFADLHDAIQDAFGWDDDHLYSFYLSGRPHDQLTELERRTGLVDPDERFFAEYEAIYADEVAIGDLDPAPDQRLLYLFDYGDELFHDLIVEAILPADGSAYPRVVAAHGEAPDQYASLD